MVDRTIDAAAVRRRLRDCVNACGSGVAAARALRISPQYLSDILHERRDPSDRVCRGIGLRRLVVYVETKQTPLRQKAYDPCVTTGLVGG